MFYAYKPKIRKSTNNYYMQRQCFPLLGWLLPLYAVLSRVLKISSDISKERGMIMKGHIKKLSLR